MKRKLSGDKCGCCCRLKEKLETLWTRAIGCINKINEITPDGDGKFTIEAGSNVQLTEISNGLKIDTTGGISYYSAGDTYIDVDNNDLEISLVNPGQSGGVALQDDLDTVAIALSNLIPSANIGTDVQPVKVVNGQLVQVYESLMQNHNDLITITPNANLTVYQSYGRKIGRTVQIFIYAVANNAITNETLFSISSTGKIRPVIQFAELIEATNGNLCGIWSSNGADEYNHNFVIPSDGTMQVGTYYISFTYVTVN